jgi:hypothetical protein
MKSILTLLLIAGLAGCNDAGLSGPAPRDPSTPSLGTIALVPFRDALERIVPSLGSSASVDAVRVALTAVMNDGSDASLEALDSALDRLVVAQPDAAVEADAIRLAIQR